MRSIDDFYNDLSHLIPGLPPHILWMQITLSWNREYGSYVGVPVLHIISAIADKDENLCRDESGEVIRRDHKYVLISESEYESLKSKKDTP